MDYMDMESTTDSDLINEWLLQNSLEGSQEEWQVLKETWDNAEKQNTFCLVSKREKKNKKFEGVCKMLGIGAKKTTLNVDDDTTKQKEFSGPKKTKLHPAFARVMQDLPEDVPWEEHTFFNVTQDASVSGHPKAKTSGLLLDDIFLIFSRPFAGVQASLTANFYSRLGGAYVTQKCKIPSARTLYGFPCSSTPAARSERREEKWPGFAYEGPNMLDMAPTRSTSQ